MRVIAFVLLASAAGIGTAYAAQRLPAGLPPSAALLLRYDANHDGVVTREEMEAGLKADFAAADKNGDGCLDVAETRAENQRRLARDGAEASPLVDWNLDGCVDFKEFANTAHSYFDLLDKTKNGKVTLQELRGPSMPIPPRPAPGKPQESPPPQSAQNAAPANSASRPPN
jgi:Ca2+-binding EF-hand superfamily protein